MTETKIFCNAECKYNKGHCTHPENLDKGCYGGIDRVYVEKCDLQKPKEEGGTMPKYIDADKMIAYLKDNLRECGNPDMATKPITYGCIIGLKNVLSYAETLPTADVVEVRHGRWTLHTDGSGTCSECGTTQKNIWDCDRWQNYCGHCGAKMDGKGKNELLENPEQLVKTNDILLRSDKLYEVVIADDNIFVICLMEYDNLEDSWITHYDFPEIYANQSSINTLKGLNFTKMDGKVTE